MSVFLRGGIAGGFHLRSRDSSAVITKRRISSVGAVTGRSVNPAAAIEQRATWLPGLEPPPYLDGKWVSVPVFSLTNKSFWPNLLFFVLNKKVSWRLRVWPARFRRGSEKFEMVCSSRACPRSFRHARCCRNTLNRRNLQSSNIALVLKCWNLTKKND